MKMNVYFADPSGPKSRRWSSSDIQFFLDTLNDPKSWHYNGEPIKWTRSTAQSSNWTISLEDQDFIEDEINKLPGPKDTITGLSVTFMHRRPRETLFSLQNWSAVPSGLRGLYSISDYRRYLVLHECGHALGLGHVRCQGGPAPIMLQQTRGLQNCTKNTWPLDREREIR